MLKHFVLAVLLASCNSPLLESGNYDVDLLYTRDDWPMSRLGERSQATWRLIQVDADSWRFSVVDASTQDLPGSTVDQHIIIDVSKDSTRFNLDIDPDSDAQGFNAQGCTSLQLEHVPPLYTCAEMHGVFAP